MPLFLVESVLPAGQTRDSLQPALQSVAAAGEVSLLEAHIAADLSRLIAVVEAAAPAAAEAAFRAGGLPVSAVKAVRLVGQDLEAVRQHRRSVNYVVEWNFPPGLTMERYLERKKANSPKYALVPQVKFHRTYVCEDMSKCLCFYDAPGKEDVLRAREAVEAPVSALSAVEPLDVE